MSGFKSWNKKKRLNCNLYFICTTLNLLRAYHCCATPNCPLSLQGSVSQACGNPRIQISGNDTICSIRFQVWQHFLIPGMTTFLDSRYDIIFRDKIAFEMGYTKRFYFVISSSVHGIELHLFRAKAVIDGWFFVWRFLIPMQRALTICLIGPFWSVVQATTICINI